MKRLDGLRWKPFWNSQLGAVKGCIEYLKLDLSDAWLFGGSGIGFTLHMDGEGYGANGPWHHGPMMNLCNNLGIAIHGVYGFQTDEDFSLKQRIAWENTQNAISKGYPCYGYNLAIPEYYVVNGYDDEGYWFSGIGIEPIEREYADNLFQLTPELDERFSVFGSETYVQLDDEELVRKLNELAGTRGYSLRGHVRMGFNGGVRQIMSEAGDTIFLQGDGFTPWTKLGTVHIGMLEMYVVEPGIRSSDRETVKDALEFALEFASSPRKWVSPPYKAGLAAYDNWLLALRSEQPNLFAQSYAAQCWSECRRLASGFLKEAAERIGGHPGVLLREAESAYAEIGEQLRAVAELMPFEGRSQEHLKGSDELHMAAVHVGQAKQLEEKGLGQLASIVNALS